MHKMEFCCIDYSNSLTCLCYLHTMKIVRFMRDGSTAVRGDWVAPSRLFFDYFSKNTAWLARQSGET